MFSPLRGVFFYLNTYVGFPSFSYPRGVSFVFLPTWGVARRVRTYRCPIETGGDKEDFFFNFQFFSKVRSFIFQFSSQM